MDLLTFLQTHPSYVDATNPTDQVLLDWCNEPVTVARDITYAQLISWGSTDGRRRELYLAYRAYDAAIATDATPGTHPYTAVQRNDLLLIEDLFKSGGDIALSDATVRTVFNSVSGNSGEPLTNADKNALLAMSDTAVDRLTANGVSRKNFGLSLINKVRND